MNNDAIIVRLWGEDIGVVFMGNNGYAFTYSDQFMKNRIEVAPLMMPLSKTEYSFPRLNDETYYGLPGMIADALPDRFGNAVINAYMQTRGIAPGKITALQRLAYIGRRGMGALEFEPADDGAHDQSIYREPLVMRDMIESARRVLSGEMPDIRSQLVEIGASAGGARAKAVIGYNPDTGNIVSGQFDVPNGYQHYLIKFDGVEGSRSGIYGRRESAYLSMAAAAGINVPDHFLLEDEDRAHLMIRRFDRTESGEKLHMQSLCGMAHLDFNQRMVTDYSLFLRIIRQIGLGAREVEEGFRRMVFNVLGVNRDDHTKNQSFLMGPQGQWSLSPSYDLAFAWNPSPDSWTHQHQMLINGKSLGITRDDLRAVGSVSGIKRQAMDEIIDEVAAAIEQWPDFAAAAGVGEEDFDLIRSKQSEARAFVFPKLRYMTDHGGNE
ncbi:MAG: type II toxin-antitoxin system HipA family toxin, partial [Halothiobacillus sp.]|nr:type II toxin-antitoxin system HipA family toxin [Halothiobacillus sp.]